MAPEVSNFLYGAVAGGTVALVLRVIETYWLGPRLAASREAREKLLLYARHLYFSCGQAEFRLKYISNQMKQKRPAGIVSLKLSSRDAKSLEWFAKEGYYITSTAYLIALVACWVVIFQRDVVFLPFRRRSDTTDFLNLVERFKTGLSTHTILWYHYLDGIGEKLIQEGSDRPRPMGFSAFSQRIFTDTLFRDYYDQLLQFLNQVASGRYLEQLEEAAATLQLMRLFLVGKRAVSEIELRSTDESVVTG